MKKQKIYRIGDSKEPTFQQMVKMASNLRNKLSTYVSIRLDATAYSVGSDSLEFVIYTGEHNRFKTWPECLAHYRKLMEGK